MYCVVLPSRDTTLYLIDFRIVRWLVQFAAASDVGPQLAPALSYFVELFYFKVSSVVLVVFLTTICCIGDVLLRDVAISSSTVYLYSFCAPGESLIAYCVRACVFL